MKRNVRAVSFGIVLTLAVSLFAACDRREAGPRGEELTDVPVKQGGSITVGTAQGIPQLNPAIRTFAWEEVLFPLLWNGLSKWTPEGEIAPDIAESWQSSDDQKVWTFKLREGVQFSNERPVDAQAVVQTFRYYLDEKTVTQERNKIESIADVTAVDDLTVEFTLSEPNALFATAVTNVKILDVDSLKTINESPVVTGPFTVKSFVPDDRLTLVRNEAYFGDRAPLDQIEIVKATDAAAASTGLRSGDLDVVWSIPASHVDSLVEEPDIVLVTPNVPSQWPSWEMDITSPPFDDVKARQALAYAVDREAVLEAAYAGQGVVSPTNNPISTENEWFAGDLPTYPYDLEKAKQLFTEAGVTEGDTLIWWGVAGQYGEWQTSGEILQASLKEIDINLRIENKEISAWAERFYPAGKKYPRLIVPNFQSTPPEPAYSLNFLLEGRCECNWNNPEFERLYRDAVAEEDPDRRKELWGDVQELVTREVPLIVPLQYTVATAAQRSVGGIWIEGGGQLHLEQAGLAE